MPERFTPEDPREWLNRARSNLIRAKLSAAGVYYEDLCFDAQQAVEKAIKALLIHYQVDFPYIHDIAELLTLLEANGEEIPATVKTAERLTRFAVFTRYPGMASVIRQEEYEEAVKVAEEVLAGRKKGCKTCKTKQMMLPLNPKDHYYYEPAKLLGIVAPTALLQIDWMAVGAILAGLAAVFGILFGLYQYRMRKSDAQHQELAKLQAREKHEEAKQQKFTRTAEERYRAALEEELGKIRILGSPDIEHLPVKLLDAFVSLDISETWRSESRFDDPRGEAEKSDPDRHFSPEKVMQRAFQKYRLLLIIGDPGSGKTTLLKYYAISCLGVDSCREFGFPAAPLPIYLPLRELEPANTEPAGLPENLANWAKKHSLDIAPGVFSDWLHKRSTLVLLDGLDEIGDLQQRKRVCEWIDRTCAGLTRARFVVTSRWTGYRKLDGIELGFDHLRADVRDFSPGQQEDFLRKWFKAVYLRELPDDNIPEREWQDKQKNAAAQKAETIIAFLNRKDNKSLRQLAAVPMLLQIMAIIWKDREHLPHSRSALYSAALSYLLDYRDRRRKLDPLLPAEKARRVLAPAALWMQEEVHKDEAPKTALHEYMQGVLNTLDTPPKAEAFCANLRDRAGLLADYGRDAYIFRHKSFREYLAGLQLLKDCHQPNRLEKLVGCFGEDWWEEPLRFFISEADERVFERFMELFFRSEVSRELDQKGQNLLQLLAAEAPQKKIDALLECLRDRVLESGKKRYLLEVLKTIGSEEALAGIRDFIQKAAAPPEILGYAREIVSETAPKPGEGPAIAEIFKKRLPSFRNPREENAEYLLIPGGAYRYSVSQKTETVPDIYFAKYPVTNKRYRRFIAYLEGKPGGAGGEKILPLTLFAEKLRAFAAPIPGYREYLGEGPRQWAGKFCSRLDDEKRFNREDQPVVGVSWFAAAAYCVWLTELQLAIENWQLPIANSRPIFRLPKEIEWEWAAAGRVPGGALREYPWAKEKGEPNPNLANYGKNVDATTPVGRYPEGATPEGLLDMAGNVWEWCENLYGKGAYIPEARALRGGSWNNREVNLRCSARDRNLPDGGSDVVGFRVVLCQS